MADETLLLKVKAVGDRSTERGVNRLARSVDNLGDQASQAARKMMRMNAASSKTRINLGPFSTNLRFAAVAVGGLILGVEKLVPLTLSLAEGLGTAGAAAGAAGLVGLVSFKQASAVATLGTKDLTDALGGNMAAFRNLTPKAQELYNALTEGGAKLKATAQKGLLPGLISGSQSAMANLPILNRIIRHTSQALGGLARTAGRKVGTKSFGADLSDIGEQNVTVIKNLGRAGIYLASGLRHVLHEAGPLAEWLSRMALRGAILTDKWLANARASGKMARFFREGRRDLTLLASATSHLVGGVFNLFGHQDVDGTKTLRNLDRLTARFESWTRSIAGKPIGPELEQQFSTAIGRLASFVGRNLGRAGQTAAGAFWHAFWAADVWGKGITALFLASKLGLTKGILKGLGGLVAGGAAGGKGGAGGVASKFFARGSPGNPMYVIDVAGGVPGGGPGKGSRAGRVARTVGKYGKYAGEIGVGAAAIVGGAQGVVTGKVPGWVPGIGGKDLTDPVVGGHHGDRGKFGVKGSGGAGDGGSWFPPVIIQLDGKTIATATARAGKKKTATK